MTDARRSAGDTPALDGAPMQARRALQEPEVVPGPRSRRLLVGVGMLATALCAGFVLTSASPATDIVATPALATPASLDVTTGSAAYDDSVDTLSRGTVDRVAALAATTTATAAAAVAAAVAPAAPTVLYVSSVAYLRQTPSASAKILATMPVGTAVTTTGAAADGWQPVSRDATSGYVKASLLSTTAPSATPAKTTSGTSATVASSYPACASGSAVEAGLAARTIAVHRAICATYPSITSFGGLRGSGGEHSTGRALDIMVSGGTGVDAAAWLRANASSFGIIEIIYQQKIWTTQRSSEGWRAMSNRGSATANHFDHIHILVR